MKHFRIIPIVFSIITMIAASSGFSADVKKDSSNKSAITDIRWRSTFNVNKKNLGPAGENQYFILKPGYKQIFKDKEVTDTLTFLNETKVIDDVTVCIMEDKEEKNGKPVEITKDYFAIDTVTQDIYYFGEDVDNYKNGKVVSHSGGWLSGVKGAKFGLMVPGKIKIGDKFYQEVAPDVGMDRAEITQKDLTVQTPAGTFTHCIKMVETSPLEKGVMEYKIYAPGVGIIDDDGMLLNKIENPKSNK